MNRTNYKLVGLDGDYFFFFTFQEMFYAPRSRPVAVHTYE